MKRAYIIVLDSLGIGSASDAYKFGDLGADTLGHIAESCQRGDADHGRSGSLNLPNLMRLGLAKAAKESTGRIPAGMDNPVDIIGGYAYASEVSSGKDTISGHWEIAGVPVLYEWDYFPAVKDSFAQQILDQIVIHAKLPGYLGNCHSSGTLILEELGEEHMRTNKPIFYTSADSVFQIACHESTFGLDRLYKLCKIVRKILRDSGYNISRVIARPFIGDKVSNFVRTGNRYDLAVEPVSPTVFKKLLEEKFGTVVSVGKVADIYAQMGISKTVKATGITALFDATLLEIEQAENNTIVFTNFVDFDSSYGHRRDVAGYALALELFDFRLPELISLVKEDDILILTADHGCDPTWKGTDHTREHVPILLYGPKINTGFYGHRRTFSDIGQTIAKHFNLSSMDYGKAF